MHTKTYIFTYFYQQYLVLFTMVPRHIWKQRNERPIAGVVSIRSRNGAPSRKGCVINGQMTKTEQQKQMNPPPPPPSPPAFSDLFL